ncbi:hypothetical protein ACJJTC_007543, partial [Scirpophaga incertulas]
EKSGEPYSGKLSVKSDLSPVFGKFEPHPAASFNMGYLVTPYPYANGGAHPLPVSMTKRIYFFYKSNVSRAHVNIAQYLTPVRMHAARHTNPLERGKKRKKKPPRKYETPNATGGRTTVSFFSSCFQVRLCPASRPYGPPPLWGGKFK